ncbi:transcription initiation factor iia large subunit-like [Stylonychia lemnae]|uniref:Transcription initiation factor iia large subunit-like n=1 Tax=Stylonychia lemnae TaxID=5949 RepID=A0A078AMR6_STYLE|nr:transcription initiation factor iia large subunit-like [Stylonychia lemnae]|eukprot:CDW82672.1 transcription initiation factor iia large subunit-like [Stylonychia lemnae]
MANSAKDFYMKVVNEVIEKNRQQFINESVSEDVLEKLKKIWEEKINEKLTPEVDTRYKDHNQYADPNFMMQQRPGQIGYWPSYPLQFMSYQQNYIMNMNMNMRGGYGYPGYVPPPISSGNQSAFHPPAQLQLGKREDHRESSIDQRKAKRPKYDNNDGNSDDEYDEEEEQDEDEALFKQLQPDQQQQQNQQQQASLSAQSDAKTNQKIPAQNGNGSAAPANHLQQSLPVKSENQNQSDQRQSLPFGALEEEKSANQNIFRVEPPQPQEQQDNDSDEEDEDDDIEQKIKNEPKDYIAAQYEKVQRTKQKYKCTFKDVIVHINNKDFVLKKLKADIFY